jgi:hypothetical protein
VVRCGAGHDGDCALDNGDPSCRPYGSVHGIHCITVRVVMGGSSVELSPESEQLESRDTPGADEVVAVVMGNLLNGGPDAVQLSTVTHELGRHLGELEQALGHPGEQFLAAHRVRSFTSFSRTMTDCSVDRNLLPDAARSRVTSSQGGQSAERSGGENEDDDQDGNDLRCTRW